MAPAPERRCGPWRSRARPGSSACAPVPPALGPAAAAWRGGKEGGLGEGGRCTPFPFLFRWAAARQSEAAVLRQVGWGGRGGGGRRRRCGGKGLQSGERGGRRTARPLPAPAGGAGAGGEGSSPRGPPRPADSCAPRRGLYQAGRGPHRSRPAAPAPVTAAPRRSATCPADGGSLVGAGARPWTAACRALGTQLLLCK